MISGSAGFLIGAVLGSFVKVLADRSLTNRSFWGRSYCPGCKHKLGWYDLSPIFSYIFLKGRCRYCKKKIGIEYLIVEIVMGVLIGFLFWQSFVNSKFQIPNSKQILNVQNFQLLITTFDIAFKTFFITVLAVLFITDIKKMLIPDRIVKPAIVIGVLALAAITIYKIVYLYYHLSLSPIGRNLLPPYNTYFQNHAIQAAEPFFYGILTGLLIGGFFWSLIIITRGKGMGGGDVKLGAFMGLVLGFPLGILATILAFFIGAVFSVALILAGKKHFGQTIPFGPFLVIGSLIVLFWGNQIIDWYLHLGR